MNDVRSIFRNVLPAGLFYMYVLIYSLILLYPLACFPDFSVSDEQRNTILSIGAILAFLSPAVGFFLGNIHHFFYGFSGFPLFYPRITHRDFIDRNGALIAEIFPEPYEKHITENSWSTINILWHSLLKTGGKDASIENRNNLLSHISHGSGVSYIASCLSPFIALLIGLAFESRIGVTTTVWSRLFCLVLPIHFLITFLHWVGYARTVEKQEYFVETILQSRLDKMKSKML